MAQSPYQIKSPALNDDAEYAALLQQLSAFSPAKLMQQSMALRKQEKLEQRYLDTLDTQKKTDSRNVSKSAEADIEDIVKDFITSGMEDETLMDSVYGGELFIKDANGVYTIDDAKFRKAVGSAFAEGSDDDKRQTAKIESLEAQFRIAGSKKNINEVFSEGFGKGKFKFDITQEGTDAEGKPLVAKAEYDIFNPEHLIQYANNPKLAKNLYESYNAYKDRMMRFKPLNSANNYVDHYKDEFTKADRIINAVRLNAQRMQMGFPSFITKERRRSDVIATVTGGGEDLGSLFYRESLEDMDISEYTNNIKRIKAQISSDKMDWRAGAHKAKSRQEIYSTYVAQNQIVGVGQEANTLETIGQRWTDPSFQINISLPDGGESGLVSMANIRNILNKSVDDHTEKIRNHFKDIARYHTLANEKIKTGKQSLPSLFFSDTDYYNTFYKMAGQTSKNPVSPFMRETMNVLGISYDDGRKNKDLKQKDRKHFIMHDNATKDAPYHAMYNQMYLWTMGYINDNSDKDLSDDGGWEKIADSPDFRNYIKERASAEGEVLENIYNRNAELLEEEKIDNKITGIRVDDDKVINGTILAQMGVGGEGGNEPQMAIIDVSQTPNDKNKMLVMDSTNDREQWLDADHLRAFVKKAYSDGKIQSIHGDDQESSFTYTNVASSQKDSHITDWNKGKKKSRPVQNIDKRIIAELTKDDKDRSFWRDDTSDPNNSFKKEAVRKGIVKLQNGELTELPQFWDYIKKEGKFLKKDTKKVDVGYVFAAKSLASGNIQTDINKQKESYTQKDLGKRDTHVFKTRVKNIESSLKKHMLTLKKTQSRPEGSPHLRAKREIDSLVNQLNEIYKKLGMNKSITVQALMENPDLLTSL